MCQINFSIQASDSDGTVVSGEGRYRVTGTTPWTNFNIANVTNTQTPDITVNGDYDLEVRVVDDQGAFSNWFAVAGGFKIGNCTANTPPTANAGVDQSVEEGNTVTLTGSGTDTDGTIVSYLWTSASGTITSPNSATTTVTGLAQGTHTFTLTVTDNDGATGTDTVVVTTTAITPVTLTLSPVVNQGLDTYSGNLEITGIEGMDELIIIREVPNISIGTTSFTVAGVQANPTASLNNTQYSISNTVFASATDIDDGVSGDSLTVNFTIIARLNGVDVASIGFNLFSDNNTNG